MAAELTHREMLRYNRQIMLRGFDFDDQERLKASCALIARLGGLGSAVALYLAAADIDRLVLWISIPSRYRICSVMYCITTVASARAKSHRPVRRSRR